MNENLYIFLIVMVYFTACFFAVRLIKKIIKGINLYLQIVVLTFFYALFYGFGIVATGGDPGFGFPAPNLISIILMWNFIVDGNLIDIYILLFWWLLIFLIILIRFLVTKGKRVKIPS